jgi:PKD repeat protein
MPVSAFRAAALLVALVLALPVPSADPAGGERAGGPAPSTPARVQPPPDPLSAAELLSQDLTVWLYPENRSIAVEGSLRLRANSALSKLTLWLHETLDLLDITQNGVPLLYTRNVERLTLDLAYPLSADGITNLSFYYNGTMWYTENGLRQDCVGWEGAYLKGSTFWYLRHHASDWFDCRLKICCPPNWTAVADGELVAEEHSAGWATYTWANDAPMLRPALAAGNYSVASKTASGINFSVYTYPQHSAIASAYLDEAQNVMAFLEGMLGPYGRRSFKIVETAHQTMSGYACSGFVMLYPAAFSGGTVRYNLLAHEIGHEWFPFATGYQGWAYPWLWEAFPEYLSCLYEMQYHGVRTRLDYDYDEYVKVHALPDVRSIASSDWDTPYSSQIVYAKGAWVLRMLHGLAGTVNFTAALKDYVDQNLWGYGSAQAFLAAAARRSPVKLDGFWDQWLNTTKALDVSLPAARQYENGTAFRLELEPENLLNGSGPVDIIIEYSDGSYIILNRGWDGKSSLLVLDVQSSVKQVRLDPDGWLLDVDRSNQAAAPVRSGRLHELRAGPPSCSEAPVEGSATVITSCIYNDGFYPVEGLRVDVMADGLAAVENVLDIPAGSWAMAFANWTPGNAGRYNLWAIVDTEDAFHEGNEQDNNGSTAVDVAARPARLDVRLGNLTAGDELVEGMPYSFNATLWNTGEAALAAVSVEYSLDGIPLGRRNVTGLAAGERRMVGLEWTARRGYHNISVRADPDGLIAEQDEGDNIANLSFFVRWHDALSIDHSPANPRSLEPVTFSVGGDAEQFRFSWDDGTAAQTTSERVVAHMFLASGRFNVRVEGLAAGLVVGEGSVEISVANRPPELSAYFDPASPLSLSTVVFTARTLDLDGKVVAVRWEFGDGASGNGSRAEHSYARPGNYTVRCTAIDNGRGENSTSLTVSIRNRPPDVGWNSVPPAFVGEKVVFTANAYDPDGRLMLCRWQFGDGSTAEGLNASHAYSKPGNYLVTVTAYDELGASRNVTGSVEVRARKTAAPAPPSTAWVLVPAVLVAASAVSAWFLWSRRRVSKQRDDFFRPPPRSGQNP